MSKHFSLYPWSLFSMSCLIIRSKFLKRKINLTICSSLHYNTYTTLSNNHNVCVGSSQILHIPPSNVKTWPFGLCWYDSYNVNLFSNFLYSCRRYKYRPSVHKIRSSLFFRSSDLHVYISCVVQTSYISPGHPFYIILWTILTHLVRHLNRQWDSF